MFLQACLPDRSNSPVHRHPRFSREWSRLLEREPKHGGEMWSLQPGLLSGGSEVHSPSLSHSMGRSPRGKPSAVAEVRCQFWHVQDANPSLLTGETPLVGLIVLMRSENSHPLKITRGREMYEGELMKRASHGGHESWGLGAPAGAGDGKRSRLRESGAAVMGRGSVLLRVALEPPAAPGQGFPSLCPAGGGGAPKRSR